MATSTTTIVTSNVGNRLCDETDFVQTNKDKGGSGNCETPEASLEKQDNHKPTSAAAVSPTMSVLYSSGFEPRSRTTYDDNEDKPISLDDFDEATEIPLIRRISIELIEKLSLDSDDDDNDQDWTKKIASIPDSSGNLIEDLEDLHAECDESSTSSMPTIIGSEQNSDGADDVDDDLEGIFSLEDEKDDEGENDGDGYEDRDSVDPLHSNFFVEFGDDYDGRKNNNSNGGSREIIDSKNTISMEKTPPSRPKTSRINPMTGQRSLTDDVQEWRNKVLSSWTLTEPKKRKRYTKRKANRKIDASGQHAYPLRRTSERIKLAVPANVDFLESSTKSPLRKKSRLLKNVAPFNHPSITDSYGDGSVSSTMTRCNDAADEAATRQEEVLPKAVPHEREIATPTFPKSKQFPMKVRIGDTNDEKEDELQVQVPARLIESHEFLAPGNNRKGRAMCSLEAVIAVEENKHAIGHIQTRTPNDGHPDSNGNTTRPPSSLRDQDLLPRMKNKRNTNQGLKTTTATARPPITRSMKMKKNLSYTTKTNAEEKARSAKRKQKKNSYWKPDSQLTKQLRKRNEAPPPNTDRTTNNCSTRIAKRFRNPIRRTANDKLKIFFGTIVSKRIHKKANGTCSEIWHVDYDDGDEEDFDKIELKEALDLYNFAKRWDKSYCDKQHSSAGKNKEKPKDVHATEKGKESGPPE